MYQAHIFISGFVHGVGYRRFLRREAKQLGLTGWVRNIPDRRVEAVLQGSEAAIKQLIEKCKKGSYFAEVKNISVEWEESDTLFEIFEIR